MTTHATGTFEFKSWNEQPYSEIEGGPKLTRASVANAFHGDVEGDSTLEYLMVYTEGTGRFIGFERLVGRVGDRAGSFVLQHSGTFEGEAEGPTVRATWSVVPGSGTGDLRGLRGEGGYVAAPGQQQTPCTLDYDLG